MTSQPSTPEKVGNQVKKYIFLRKLGKIIGLPIGFLLVLFLFFNIAFRIPYFQKSAVSALSFTISSYLGTQNSIGSISLSGLTEFRINKVYIEDPNKDTLIYAEKIYARLHPNLFKIFTHGLVIYELSISDSKIYLNELENFESNSLSWLIKKFGKKKGSNSSEKIKIYPEIFNLNSVSFIQNEPSKGIYNKFSVVRAFFSLDKNYANNHQYKIKLIELFEPVVYIKKHSIPGAVKDSLPFQLPMLDLSWKNFVLTNGKIAIVKEDNSIVLSKINAQISDACYSNGLAEGEIKHFSFVKDGNFELTNLKIQQFSLLENKLIFKNLAFFSGNSNFSGDFMLQSKDIFDVKKIKESLQFEIDLNENRLFVNDVVKLFPTALKLPFIQFLKNENISFSGKINGNFNRMVGSNIKISLSEGSIFEGKINVRNILSPKEELINLKVKSLYLSEKTLKKTIRLVKLDSSFTKLQFIRFNGSFDGFLNNFVAFGNVTSSLGNAELDLQLNFRGGKEYATYTGNIGINDFKLGKFLNQPQFGNVSLNASITNGRGFSSKTATADFSAVVKSFEYKRYVYKNAKLLGTLNAKRFKGEFYITDENIDFSFDGFFDFRNQEVPQFNFLANVKHLDLKALNITNKSLNIKGLAIIDFKNKKWSDLEGLAVLSDIEVQNDTNFYLLDNLSFISKSDGRNRKRVEIQSEIIEVDIQGNFDIEKIPNAIKNLFFDVFPGFTQALAWKRVKNIPNDFDIIFNARIKKSSGWETLLLPGLSNINGTEIKGEINYKKNLSLAAIKIPNITFNNLVVRGTYAQYNLNNNVGRFDVSFDGIKLGNQSELPPFVFLSSLNKDEINFQTRLGSDSNLASALLELNGKIFSVNNDKIALKLGSKAFRFLAGKWKVNPQNILLLSTDSYEIQHMNFSSGEQELRMDRFKNKGLKVSLKNLALSRIDSLIKFTLKFSGKLNADFSFEDWKGFKNMTLKATSDALLINKKDWGNLIINAQKKSDNHPISAQFSLLKGNAALHLSAFYNVKDIDVTKEKQKGYFDLQLNAYNFPNNFAAYFLEGVLSNIQGKFDADIHFDGKFPKLNTAGTIFLSEGGVTVDYLKTRYTYKATTVPVNNQLFDLTGGVLYDKYNHTAQITGGVSHDYLKKFGFKAKLSSKRFLCLDTQKGDNSTFYGQAIGTGDVIFSGSFKLPDIYVKASVSDSTRVIIPISSEIATQNIKNVRFVNKQKEGLETAATKSKPILKGLSFDMDLEAKTGAVLEMVFNEQTGDILKVTGRGGVRLSVMRNEPFKMFGDISIDDGSYLFTYLAINKNFKLRPRGTISWNGDPYKASINIEATYDDINASTSILIQEYLATANQNVKSEASQNTPVTLILKLQGDLFKPKITFDLAFPALQGALKNYVDSKLIILRQDVNELNKQVFGLIVAGQFLPAVFSMSGTSIVYNTVSEFVSNQLSLIVNQLIANLIGKGDIASGTNFDIAYNRNPNFVITDFRAGNELQVSLKQSLFNDRLTVMVGGNLDNNFFGGSSESTTFLGNDVVVEYDLNKDKSLKFRVYQKLQPDFSGRRLRFGTGVSYRKEFESFADFLSSFKKN